MPQPPASAHDIAATAGSPANWWREAVIYQVYPRSFADGNGDGMGDLPGVRSRPSYLKEFGVDALWLNPFYASPQADAGYDIADHRAVEPTLGTLLDAEALIRDAHGLGLRIVVDLVPNHSSDRHEWFLRALEEGPGSALRERYHFHPGEGENGELPPNDWTSVFGGPAWTRTTDPDGSPGDWYLHLFAPEQPDFNWEHPSVADEFRSILRFWLDRGVDGFRVDVAQGLIKAEGLPDIGRTDQRNMLGTEEMPSFDQDGVHEIYRSWRRIFDEYPGQRIAVAEAWTPTEERTARYVRPDELHQAFNFSYMCSPWGADEFRQVIDAALDAMRRVGAPTTWVLSNHDTTRHSTRFAGPQTGSRLAGAGGRALGLRRARAATLLMPALPGAAYLYQGEELGLPEVTDLPDEVRQDPTFARTRGEDGIRDGCRVPIPWTVEGTSCGFGTGGSWLPQPEGWGALSVEAQTGDPDSTLELYRSALAVRRAHPGLGAGDAVEWTDAPAGVLVFRRQGFVCTTNTTDEAVRIPAPGRLLLASSPVGPANGSHGASFELDANATVWWTV
ncbi:alpha-amylase family glycosyl hydrolase [Streptomyces sp. JV185]|uniref:glycoside hydrolase family 13 protein n=1 Tax=Streptomyces sp. JV185 TaxID=858638 RepID=UPI002E7A1019|nr:alpha-amylase family glycosyl hydrolase [Streptomyces sp. JV185]MEE1768144.1 alpha-amylase family glycosyl hydrolase [Streptomyces sp. JV185]